MAVRRPRRRIQRPSFQASLLRRPRRPTLWQPPELPHNSRWSGSRSGRRSPFGHTGQTRSPKYPTRWPVRWPDHYRRNSIRRRFRPFVVRDSGLPLFGSLPGPQFLSQDARLELQRQGLFGAGWRARLSNASQPLIKFINRFYSVPGFGLVLRDMFAGPYRRSSALLLGKLARTLADQNHGFEHRMGFERSLGFAASGSPVLVIDLFHDGIRFRPMPWTQVQPRGLSRQLLYDASVFQTPHDVQWVFDQRRLNLDRDTLIDQIKAHLRHEQDHLKSSPDTLQWLSHLDQFVVMI